MDLPQIPRWEGEPTELFGAPPSEEGADWESKLTPQTGYHLAHVLNDAGLFDPSFIDSLPALNA